MRKTTSAVVAGLLGVGSAVALSVAVPGIASANGCGTATLTETTFPTTFDSLRNDTRTAGSIAVEDGALRVTTTPSANGNQQSKASAYYDIANLPLADQTAQSNYGLGVTNLDGTKPGYNLVVDVNGAAAGGTTTLVFEDGYGGKWWANPKPEDDKVQGVPGGLGYPHLGTIQQYSDANPDAVVLAFGFSLGSGVVGDNRITSITFGCSTFTFDLANRAPVAKAAVDNASDSDYRTYWLSGTQSTDPDGDQLTYSWTVNGTVVSTAAEFKHTFPKGAGTYQVALTVNDGALSNTTTTEVKVTPPADTIGGALPDTGANVTGMAALGGLVVVGSGVGLLATRRRKAGQSA